MRHNCLVPRKPATTLTQRNDLVVVVIGGPDALIRAAREVARGKLGARLTVADVTNAANVVAESRPFAIVMTTDLYALDPAEFDALARDVGARLISLETYGHALRIRDEITPLLVAALEDHKAG